MKYQSSSQQALRRTARAGAALFIVSAALGAQVSPPAAAGLAKVRGTVFDSVHQVPLANAQVLIDGVPRVGLTDANGSYSIDSVPPGSYRIYISHPLLDTLGVILMTPPLTFRGTETTTADIALPSGEKIVAMRCAPGFLARGPGALVGQVTDPDSLKPAVGSKVQLVYEDAVLIRGMKPRPIVREAIVDSTGGYKICGLPTPLSGKLQVFRNGVSSGQVEVQIDGGPLGLRSLSIAAAQVATTVADSTGKLKRVFVGNSRLTGIVLSQAGQPVEGARVSLEGAAAAALTNAKGEFTLDSLPAGTQSVEVRKLGHGPAEQSVELTRGGSTSVTVRMDPYVLPEMRVEAKRDRALETLGFTDRKKSTSGYFMDGNQIRREAGRFSDVLRSAPTVKVVPGQRGRNVIQAARDPMGCVTFFVDGTAWTEMSPGDIDDYIQPGEVAAIEIYNPASTPGRFTTSGSTKCATVVVWTAASINRVTKR